MNIRRRPWVRVVASAAITLSAFVIGAQWRPSSVAQAQVAPAWTSIGPVGGRVTAVAIDPNGKIYAGTTGGVFTSTDTGKTWTTNTDGLASNNITALSIDPNKMANPTDPQNPWPIYAGTGGSSGGVLKSVDGGKTWAIVNPNGVFSGVTVAAMGVDARSTLYVATFKGMYISADGGNTFPTLLLQPTFANGVLPVISSLVLDSSTNPTTVYAAVTSMGIEKSTDGKTFTVLTNGLPPGANDGNTAIAMAPSNHQVLYTSISNGTTLIGIFKTTDGGNTWTSLPKFVDFTSYGPGQGGQAFGNNNLIVSPTDPNSVWGAGVHLARTTDGGNTWQDLNDPNLALGRLGLDFNALAYDAQGDLFAGHDFNLGEYTAAGQVVDLTGNMTAKMFYPNLSQFGNGTLISGGTQDNGSWLHLTNGTWRNSVMGDAYGTGIDPLDPNVLYAATNGGLTMTTDQFGMSMKTVTPPQDTGGLSDRHIAVAPNPGNTDAPVVYYGLNQVSTSPDGGKTWKVGTGAYSPPGGVTALTVSTANAQVAYAGFADGTVQFTKDQGGSWTTIAPPSGAPNCSNCAGLTVSDIAVDPNNAANVTVTVTNGNGAGSGTSPPHVIAGTNATTATPTWTEVTGNLPNESTDAVAYNGTSLVVGTLKGVYSGTPNGANTTWTTTAPGFPKVPVQNLLLAPNGTLTASTYGRSIWQTTLPALSANGAGTMTVTPAFPMMGATGLTFTFTYTAAQGGLTNGEVDVSVPGGWTAPTTGNTTVSAGTLAVNGSTIQVTGVTLGVGQTLTITYGQGGAVTAPGNTVASTFATSEASSSPGTPVPIAVQPIITTTATGGTVPAAPTNVTVSAPTTPCTDGSGGLSANWTTPPTDGGSPTTEVDVSFTLPGQKPTVGTFDGLDPTATSDGACGLDKTKSYTANVWYVNANGQGAVASSTNAVTPARRPPPPSNLQTVAGNGAVDVTWTPPPSNNGSPVLSYTITAQPGGATVTVPYYEDPAQLTGLSDSVPYTISVTAKNEDGSSDPVATSGPVTPSATPNVPDAPTDVGARGGNGEAFINWTPPASDNGSSILHYTVTAHPGGKTVTVDGSRTSATMTGLTDGTGYYFTVVATNGVGNSPASAPSANNPYVRDQAGMMMVETKPAAPTNVRALPGTGSATVSWDDPSRDGGSEIGQYIVEAMPGGLHTSVDGIQTSAVISGLHNGTAYTFTVWAVNAVGMGPPSKPTVPVTPIACTVINGSTSSVELGPGVSCVTGIIQGSLSVTRGATVLISNATILGSLAVGTSTGGAASVQLCGSSVRGTTAITSTTGFVLIGDPFDDDCAGNQLGSVSVLSGHGGVDVIGNTILGSVTVSTNQGTGPMDDDSAPAIGYNVIHGSLACSGNVPPPTNAQNPNDVIGQRSNQCSHL